MICALLHLAYLKDHVLYITHIIWCHCFLNFLPCSIWLHDYVTITVTMFFDITDVWQYNHDVTLNSNPSFFEKKVKKKKKLKETWVQTL